MSRLPQDQFIGDDEEEVCPLCIEEFDLQDKNFKPCPCGYQICQFCYNNIKTNMNGLCPACRRPYDDNKVEWKQLTAEELAHHKAEIAAQAKKKAAARQKEAQKREADALSRKHLAGLRVVQKNLVYVTGLAPTSQQEQLMKTLRGDQYFGQYGDIIKIVVSKSKETPHHSGREPTVGVYVTFARKEDAANCIAAVNGSVNNGRTLRAQYGTTKYCSNYLRNEQCTNRNCMFLHEPGEENESFTRQDLSSMNIIGTQQPTQSHSSSSHTPQPQPPPQTAQPVAAASNNMNHQEISEATTSPSDGPALPSTASWGSKASQTQSRRMSRATNSTAPSPLVTMAVPAVQPQEVNKTDNEPQKKGKEKEASAKPTGSPSAVARPATPPAQTKPAPPTVPFLDDILKAVGSPQFKFTFSAAAISPEDFEIVTNLPCFIDPLGGEKRRRLKQREEEHRKSEPETQGAATAEGEEITEGGSVQLGGEPEERHEIPIGQTQQHAIQPPSQPALNSSGMNLGTNFPLADELASLGLNARGLTHQQQQQLLLQQFKSANPQSANVLNAFQGGQTQQNQPQSGHAQQGPSAPAHARNASRFSFANDGPSATTHVKPVANAKLMNQQVSMMPQGASHFNQLSQHQPLTNQFYNSGVQGPPPGLKTTGTPPVSGGGMFAQGHGFTTGGLGYGANTSSRNANEEMMQDLLRRRGNASGSQVHDAGKRELMFPSFLNQHPPTSTPAPGPGLLGYSYGPQSGAYQESGSSKQKKKGKKHRHATTSSSGGGVVDVADPSILQARLHQGGMMAGQGLYAGQGQGDFDHSLSRQISQSVDDLVNEPSFDTVRSPTTSAHLEQLRRATPTIPPGFSALLNVASLDEVPTPRTRAAIPSSITPAVPVLPVAPYRISTPTKKDAKIHDAKDVTTSVPSTPNIALSEQTSSDKHPADEGSRPSSRRQKDWNVPLALTLLKSKERPETPKEEPNRRTANQKEFSKDMDGVKTPPDDTATAIITPTPEQIKRLNSVYKRNEQKESANARKGFSSSNKRQHPGRLDIAAATQAAEKDQPSAPVKADETQRKAHLASNNNSRPSTPAGSAASPIKAKQPRTLRVIATPKTETPPPLPVATSTTVEPATKTSGKSNSRQPSVASINPPGTPLSELVSDNASVTSASISVSRASSPPPTGRVGSAPIRKKTKSQAKKERQERAKQIAEEKTLVEETLKSPIEGVVQAPIVSRKKKAKKPTANRNSGPIPTTTPASPTLKEKVRAEKDTRKDVKSPRALTKKEKVTAASILADLQATNALLASALDDLLKSVPSLSNTRHDLNPADKPAAEQAVSGIPALSEADLAQLQRGEPIRLGGEDGRLASRTLVTPAGTYLRGLSKETEERFLELEKRVRTDKSPCKWSPQLIEGGLESQLPRIDLGDGKNGKQGNGTILASSSGAVPIQHVSGKGEAQDEASSYLNQMVPMETVQSQITKTGSPQINFQSLGGELFNKILNEGYTGGQLGWNVPGFGLPGIGGVVKGDSRPGQRTLDNNSAVTSSNVGDKVIPTKVIDGIPSVKEAEELWRASKQETDAHAKRLNKQIAKNKSLVASARNQR